MLAGSGMFGTFRHFRGQFATYSRRLVVIPGSLLAAAPAVSARGVLFTGMSSGKYATGWWQGDSVTWISAMHDAFHPTVSSGVGALWLESASADSRIVRLPLNQTSSSHAITLTGGEQPVISSDGKWLVFVRETQGRGSLWLREIGADSTAASLPEPERQLSPGALDVLEATFAPDDRVVFSAQSKEKVPELFVISALANTGAQSKLYVPGPARFPAISPDGQWMAFSRREGTAWKLWVLRTDTGETRRLSDADCNSISPAWFPDSKRLVYATDCGRGLGLAALCWMQAVP
jgi:Tol biopolymer transport system component